MWTCRALYALRFTRSEPEADAQSASTSRTGRRGKMHLSRPAGIARVSLRLSGNSHAASALTVHFSACALRRVARRLVSAASYRLKSNETCVPGKDSRIFVAFVDLRAFVVEFGGFPCYRAGWSLTSLMTAVRSASSNVLCSSHSAMTRR